MKWLGALILVLLGSAGATYYALEPAPIHIGDERMDRVLNSKDLKLKRELKSARYILLNFWASWCPPCIEEMPSLIEFAHKHKEFLFISVSQDSSSKEFLTYLKAFPALIRESDALMLDRDQSAGLSFHVEQLPETFIYDLKLHKSFLIQGAIDWSRSEVLTQIEAALAK